MNETTQLLAICTTGVLMLGIIVGGPASCAIVSQQEATRRVAAACAGDLHADGARSAACALALIDARSAGSGF